MLQIFNHNKYTNLYFKMISNATNRTLHPDTKIEKHHIIPKSLGGSDDKENLINLTLREHYIVHLLIIKALKKNSHKAKMMFALGLMTRVRLEHNFNSRLYEKFKTKYRDSPSKRYYNAELDHILVVFDDEQIEIPSGYVAGIRPHSEEHKQKLRKPKRVGHKSGSTTKGKNNYINDITGETIRCIKENAPFGDGWRQGNSTKGISKPSYAIYHNPERTEQKYCYSIGEIPTDWIKGRITSEKQLLAARNNSAFIKGKSSSNKGKLSYHDPITLIEKTFTIDSIIPEGWVKGRSPKNIRSGFTQSDRQKEAVRQTGLKNKGNIPWNKTYKIA